jgi:hypothetical protein
MVGFGYAGNVKKSKKMLFDKFPKWTRIHVFAHVHCVLFPRVLPILIEVKSYTSTMWNVVGAERTSTTPNRIVIYRVEH